MRCFTGLLRRLLGRQGNRYGSRPAPLFRKTHTHTYTYMLLDSLVASAMLLSLGYSYITSPILNLA
jgi:hypothetical protein